MLNVLQIPCWLETLSPEVFHLVQKLIIYEWFSSIGIANAESLKDCCVFNNSVPLRFSNPFESFRYNSKFGNLIPAVLKLGDIEMMLMPFKMTKPFEQCSSIDISNVESLRVKGVFLET